VPPLRRRSAWTARSLPPSPASDVVCVTERAGVGFHSPHPDLTWNRRLYFWGNPCPAPIQGPAALIPCTGPVCYHLFLAGTRLGYGWGGNLSGDRGRECIKDTPHQAIEWGGAGKRGGDKGRGPAIFRGPVCPVTNSSQMA